MMKGMLARLLLALFIALSSLESGKAQNWQDDNTPQEFNLPDTFNLEGKTGPVPNFDRKYDEMPVYKPDSFTQYYIRKYAPNKSYEYFIRKRKPGG